MKSLGIKAAGGVFGEGELASDRNGIDRQSANSGQWIG
jgi:hypothetical protein